MRVLVTRYLVRGVKRLRKLWVDGGDQAEGLTQGVSALKHPHKIDVEVTDHEGKGLQVVPWRGAVERPFAWLLTARRQSRDYERLTTNREALIQLSMIRI